MQNNFPKTPLFLSIIFFIFSCSVFLYFLEEINNNNQESQLKEMEWQTEALRRYEIKALDRSIKIIEGERAQLETHFAKSSDIVPFLDTIERLAPQVGTKAEVTSVNVSEDHTGLYVGMEASGTFNGLYKFLTLLENSPYELEFVSMDIKKGLESWEAILKIKLLSFIG
ncbi:MAG: hypothetical protein G01um101424_77 [Parcubacteria group bacterium Gr01-1014_24]|nr:MAG: hypothetical protein G01um101424_77 [Parcubacteria group bacterium Gr01-1014_24]